MRKYLGKIAVDSGQIAIVDPCYVSGKTNEDWYADCCAATLSEDGSGLVLASGKYGRGAVVCSGGDGHFPVFVETDEAGRRIVIELESRGAAT